MSTCNNNDAEKGRLGAIQALYTELAESPHKDFGWGKGRENARSLGYAAQWLRRFGDSLWESAAAVGSPFCAGRIECGETVVDLGCGAGADACVAALLVGATGRVIGVDCTPAMVAKARANAAAAGLGQIELYEADIADLPLPDGCADVVISNSALNLSTAKERVLAEAYRVLRPAGRLQIADMVKDPSAAGTACCTAGESWADCVAGALAPDAFIALLVQAGLVQAELLAYSEYRTSAHTIGALFRGVKPSAEGS